MLFRSLVKNSESSLSEAQRHCPPPVRLQQLPAAEPSPGHRSREYFRINTEISVRYWALDNPLQIASECSASVNLSAGGLRLRQTIPLKLRQEVVLALTLPGEHPVMIECLGKVVRFGELGEGRREVAFEYTRIAGRDRDRIIAFCLAEQRRVLRQKVRVD